MKLLAVLGFNLLASMTQTANTPQAPGLAPNLYEVMNGTPQQAIAKFQSAQQQDICQETAGLRTTSIHIVNNTNVSIKLAFFQGLMQTGQAPIGFVKDTGTYVGCKNEPAGANCDSDPCYAGGSPKPIQTDVCKASVQVFYNNQTQTLNPPDQKAPAGTYYKKCGWTIQWSAALIGGKPSIEIVPMLDVEAFPDRK